MISISLTGSVITVIIITMQITGMVNTLNFFTVTKQRLSYLDHSTSSGLLFEKGVILSFYRKRQSDIAMYYSWMMI